MGKMAGQREAERGERLKEMGGGLCFERESEKEREREREKGWVR